MNTQELIDRLFEIHNEFMPDTISAAAFEAAYVKGYADPCGCALCQLMNDLAESEREKFDDGIPF